MITDYTSLQTAIMSWLARTDAVTTAQVPTFIALAESAIRRVLRDDTGRATITISQESTPLPAYVGEIRSLRVITGLPDRNVPIIVTTTEIMSDFRARSSNVAGTPRYAAVVGGNLLVVPQPDAAYDCDMTYFTTLPSLSATNPTNTVLLNSPDVYLYGSLAHAEGFLEHDERIPQWKSAFDSALQELEAARQGREYGPSRQRAGLPRVF